MKKMSLPVPTNVSVESPITSVVGLPEYKVVILVSLFRGVSDREPLVMGVGTRVLVVLGSL